MRYVDCGFHKPSSCMYSIATLYDRLMIATKDFFCQDIALMLTLIHYCMMEE
jgi:hypothetical protein